MAPISRRNVVVVLVLAILLVGALTLPLQASRTATSDEQFLSPLPTPPPPPAPLLTPPAFVTPGPLPIPMPTIAPIATGPVAPPEPSACLGFNYKVVRGDTLTSIARRFGTTVAAIQRCNHMWNTYSIYPGKILLIPTTSHNLNPMPGPLPGPEPGPNCSATHYVRYGETLASIARMYHTTVNNLLHLNPKIYNANIIWPGEAIKVPADCR
jgi:LysM repeat protein